jgi:hypothetical protein
MHFVEHVSFLTQFVYLFLGMGADEPKLESRSCYRYWTYITGLCSVMYNEGLLDRQEFLQWIQGEFQVLNYCVKMKLVRIAECWKIEL